MIRQEVRILGSRYVDGTLMYPGKWLFTWGKVTRHLPWMLMSIEPFESEVVS